MFKIFILLCTVYSIYRILTQKYNEIQISGAAFITI